jgi:hydrocephalus-inducing protein
LKYTGVYVYILLHLTVIVKVDNKDFHVDKTINAAPGSSSGTEVTFEVTFEPSQIGESRGLLTVSSIQGGDYTFPLFGTCIPPKPQVGWGIF